MKRILITLILICLIAVSASAQTTNPLTHDGTGGTWYLDSSMITEANLDGCQYRTKVGEAGTWSEYAVWDGVTQTGLTIPSQNDDWYVESLCTDLSGRTGSGSKIIEYSEVVPAASYGPELAINSNATDDIGGNEANATTGWSESGTATWGVSTLSPSNGVYHLYATADAINDRVTRTFPNTITSTLFRIRYDIRHVGIGGNWTCFNSSGAFFANRPLKTISSSDIDYQVVEDFVFYSTHGINTVRCRSSASDGGIYIDNFSMVTATLPLGPELFVESAASIANEGNDTNGWATLNGNAIITSVSVAPQEGSYHLNITTSATNTGVYYDLSTILTDNEDYLISFKSKKSITSTVTIGLTNSISVFYLLLNNGVYAGTTWTHNGFVKKKWSSTEHRYLVVHSGAAEESIDVDSISIKKVLGY